ncbi:MAG: polyphosphate kinase, partial [Gemmatimonadota bacterium]
MMLEPVPPGAKLDLDDDSARASRELPDGDTLRDELKPLLEKLDGLQRALYAENKRALLVVVQGRDAAGKDGLIRKVFGPLNSQGCQVTSFKGPSELELAHDYLWRVHQAIPRKGFIGIFNRSHYEDVLVVRVHRLIAES